MHQVLVVGGGTAGVEAAKEAARSGAKVSLLEASDRLGRDQSLFPYLLSGASAASDALGSATSAEALSDRFDVEVELGHRVKRIDISSKTVDGDRAQSGPAHRKYDSLVLATGASYVPEEIKGSSKPGVWMMRTEDDFLSLARALPGLSHVVVVGPSAALAFSVAQELSRRVKSSLFVSSGGLGALSPGIRSRVVAAASGHGVKVVDAGVQAVVGMKRVEAVVSAELVQPCDAVVVLPRSSPSVPDPDCQRGASGGLMVDGGMRTSRAGVFAAGDCAELRVGSGSVPFKVHSSARTMGRTAGSNAVTGGASQAALAGTLTLELFGMQLCTAGLQVAQGRALGLDLEVMEDGNESGPGSEDQRFQTSVVFQRESHRVYGLQALGDGATLLSGHITTIVSAHSTLEDVANQDSPVLPSSGADVSPICLTARKLVSRLRG